MIIQLKDRADLINMAHCLVAVGDAIELKGVINETDNAGISSANNWNIARSNTRHAVNVSTSGKSFYLS